MKPKSTSLSQSRRVFLQSLGIFSCATLLPSVAFSQVDEELFSETRLLMGTFVHMTVKHAHKATAEKALHAAFSEIERLEGLFSRHKESALTTLNRKSELYGAPQELLDVALFSQRMEEATQGFFNPAVLPVLEYMEQNKTAISTNGAALQSLMQEVPSKALALQYDNIHLQKNTRITFDGVAKGYIVDATLVVLEKFHIEHCFINAGGDIRAKGIKAASFFGDTGWKVTLEDPKKQGAYPGTIALYNKAIATSGSYEKNFGQGLHHLIIPQTQKAVQKHQMSISPRIQSISVLADTAMQADALATALSCMPVDDALAFVEARKALACAIIQEDNTLLTSKRWSFTS